MTTNDEKHLHTEESVEVNKVKNLQTEKTQLEATIELVLKEEISNIGEQLAIKGPNDFDDIDQFRKWKNSAIKALSIKKREVKRTNTRINEINRLLSPEKKKEAKASTTNSVSSATQILKDFTNDCVKNYEYSTQVKSDHTHLDIQKLRERRSELINLKTTIVGNMQELTVLSLKHRAPIAEYKSEKRKIGTVLNDLEQELAVVKSLMTIKQEDEELERISKFKSLDMSQEAVTSFLYKICSLFVDKSKLSPEDRYLYTEIQEIYGSK